MAKPTGSTKTGGRTKGTPNKNNLGLAELLSEYNYDPVASILKKYDKLPIQDQLKVDFKLLDFIHPRRKAIELDVQSTKDNPFKGMSLEELKVMHAELAESNRQTFDSLNRNKKTG